MSRLSEDCGMCDWKILRCPGCGGNINAAPPKIQCNGCGLTGSVNGKVVTFPSQALQENPTPKGRLRALADLLDSRLHPLRGSLSPLRWYSQRRVEGYYERCLTDRRLADAFRDHYLPPVFRSSPGAALDVGCGRGRIVALLAQLGFDVTGLDISPHAYWEKVTRARFVVAAGQRLPFEDSAFDLITHFGVLMYLEDPVGHLRELRRLLKPRGFVSLQVTNRFCLRNLSAGRFGDASFFRLYSQDELRSLLGDSGFHVEHAFAEAFYAPICPLLVNFVRRVLVARELDLFDRDSLFVRLTPPKYRGVINVTARKA